MPCLPRQWMAQQQQKGHRLCLMLEGGDEARQPLLAARSLSQYQNLYAETVLATLAASGPVILLLEQLNEPALVNLLQRPETNWGWLGSLPGEALGDLARHWRDRLIIGPEDDRAFYRCHDNRTLGRALAHLPAVHWPAYLGPLISVCYWHDHQWHCHDNPSPGDHPPPIPEPWLDTPNPQAVTILHSNILRYLLAEHSEDLAALVALHDPNTWLTQVLEQARAWQWRRPEQLAFLVVRRLEEVVRDSVMVWQARVGETPEQHFERLMEQWHLMRKQDE
ncbi:DUF4123 domain-containing protein [Pseudomonas sp. SDO5271_S396]